VIKARPVTTARKAPATRNPGVLAMRGIEGRGKLTTTARTARSSASAARPGINTRLSFQDYERIMGNQRVDDERHGRARKDSSKKGRWERKLDAVRSSLENFIPDVRPGNQTALKTRAHPYALYISAHAPPDPRAVGFGFLENLDGKGSDYPLNDPNLWVNSNCR